jgi:UMF1 family MFS transporter
MVLVADIRKRAVAGWVLYDLANTIFSLNIVSLYFSIWAVNVMGGSDSHYGVTYGLSMLVVFGLSPFLGAMTDQSPRRMPYLVATTALCVGLTVALGTGGLALSLVLFAVANIAYQAGLQFYDALLPEVSRPRDRGRIGGLGIGAGYLGALLGATVGGLLLRGVEGLALPEQVDRYRDVFRASGMLFLVLALPCFFLVRERARPGRRFDRAIVSGAVRQVLTTFRESRRFPGLFRFLFGRALYTDAVNTVIPFMGIYVTNEVGFTAAEASLVIKVAIVCAAAGGFGWGFVVDRIGPKRTLRVVLVLWMITLAWAAAVGFARLPGAAFWPVPLLAGVALGGTWAADRPFMLRLTPPERIGEFYGLYGMMGRFGAVAGPFVWALVADGLDLGRPAAVTALLLFVVGSLVVIRRVPEGREGEFPPGPAGRTSSRLDPPSG